MKKIVLLFIFISGFVFGQNEFEIDTKNYFTRIVVRDASNLSKNILFQKTKEWLSKTYVSDKIIQTQIENEFIRTETITKGNFCYKLLGSKLCRTSKFVTEYSFKDGKYRVEIVDWKLDGINGGWDVIPLESIFKKDSSIRPSFYYVEFIESLNKINNSLNDYINGISNSVNDNW